MEQSRGFVDLACPTCGTTMFTALLHLKHRAGGGLVAEPVGYACLVCQTHVDMQAALNAYSLRVKREELKALEAELGIDHADTRGEVSRDNDAERPENPPRLSQGSRG